MNELKRILSDRKRVLILLAIPLVSLFWFFSDNRQTATYRTWDGMLREAAKYREYRETVKEMQPEEAAAYLNPLAEEDPVAELLYRSVRHVADFPAYQQNVQKQAERQAASSIFSKDKTSFVYRNIIKTAKDFEPLLDLEVYMGNDNGLERWLAFHGADWCYLAVLLLLVMAFFEEKKSGLSPLIRSCPGGRFKLYLSRLFVTALFAAVYTVLLYGLSLIASLIVWGGAEGLERPVQSLLSCRTCTYRITILEGIFALFAGRILSGILLTVFLWFMLGFLSQTQLAWAICFAVLAAEYLLYTLVPVQSAFSVFRHVNLFTYVHLSDGLTRYLNINFFKIPLSLGSVLILTGTVLLAALLAGVTLTQLRRYPLGNRDVLSHAVRMWNRFADAVRRRFPLFAFEIYKYVIMSAALLFMLLAVFLRGRLTFYSYAYTDVNDLLYDQYVNAVEGPVTDKTYAFFENAQKSIDSFSGGAAEYQHALDRLKAEVQKAEEAAAQRGEEPWILNQRNLNNVFGAKTADVHRKNGLIVMALLIALLSPLFAFENQAGVPGLLRSAKKGRTGVLIRKLLIMLFSGLCLFAVIYSREWEVLSGRLGVSLGAPVQDMDVFRNFPLRVSLKDLMILTLVLRIASLLITGIIMITVSMRCKGWETAFLLGCALLLIPSVLTYAGIPYLNLLPFFAGYEAFSGKTAAFVINLVFWLAAAAFSWILAKKTWIGAKNG